MKEPYAFHLNGIDYTLDRATNYPNFRTSFMTKLRYNTFTFYHLNDRVFECPRISGGLTHLGIRLPACGLGVQGFKWSVFAKK